MSRENSTVFVRFFKSRRLSLTPQGVAFYKALIACDDHPRDEDIFNLVRASFPDISMDTVYRTLTRKTRGKLGTVTYFHPRRLFDCQ